MNLKYFYMLGMGLLYSNMTWSASCDIVQIYENVTYFDHYYFPLLVFYIFYFVEKYFFRLFFSGGLHRAALAAGLINVLSAVSTFVFLYVQAHLNLQDAISFMCTPEMYVFATLQFKAFTQPVYFALSVDLAFVSVLLFKFLLLRLIFEEAVVWLRTLVVLMMARLLQIVLVYSLILYIPLLIEFLSCYMSVSTMAACIIMTMIIVDVVCASFFKRLDSHGEEL